MPLGLTFLLAIIRAMLCASLENVPRGGKVETVFTRCDQYRALRFSWGLLDRRVDFMMSLQQGRARVIDVNMPIPRRIVSHAAFAPKG